ncbi:MAG: transporter substrate-binding domain-containing protein, partial [Pseudomonadota bacterium]
AEVLEIAGSPWPPYQMMENGTVNGIGTEVIRRVLDNLGMEHRFSLFPWKRCVMMYERGEVDAVYLISRTQDREAFLHFPKTPICTSTYVFFIRRQDLGRLKFGSYEDLVGQSVGVTSGYAYSESFWDGVKNRAQVQEASTDEQNFLKLANGRFGYFPCDLYVGAELLKTLGLKGRITFLPKPVVHKDYFLAFSKKSAYKDLPVLMEAFDEALHGFIQSEAYMDLMNRYLP